MCNIAWIFFPIVLSVSYMLFISNVQWMSGLSYAKAIPTCKFVYSCSFIFTVRNAMWSKLPILYQKLIWKMSSSYCWSGMVSWFIGWCTRWGKFTNLICRRALRVSDPILKHPYNRDMVSNVALSNPKHLPENLTGFL